MTRRESCHLIDMLAEIPYPRNNKGKRHPLVSILVLVVIGLMDIKDIHLSLLGTISIEILKTFDVSEKVIK